MDKPSLESVHHCLLQKGFLESTKGQSRKGFSWLQIWEQVSKFNVISIILCTGKLSFEKYFKRLVKKLHVWLKPNTECISYLKDMDM